MTIGTARSMCNTLYCLLLLTMIACSPSVSVSYDVDKSVDFSGYGSIEFYGWSENSNEIISQLSQDRLESAFFSEFEKRNISVVDENADLTFSLYLITKQKTELRGTSSGVGMSGYYGYGPGWGWGGGYTTTTYQEYDYTVGTLIISVYDEQKKQLVWEGYGKSTSSTNGGSKFSERAIQLAAAKIMSNFPRKRAR